NERLTVMRNHGSKPKYYHRFVGGNFRLDPIQAAVLLVKLRCLDDWSAARRRNAAYYDRAFAGNDIGTPYINPDCVSIYNQYVIRTPRRDELLAALKSAGVGTEVYYPLPLHLQECFRELGYKPGDMPEAENAAREVLALPVYPELTRNMLDAVISVVL